MTTTNPTDVAELTATLAAVRDELGALTKTVDGMRQDIRSQTKTFIPRQEWDAHRAEVDRRITATEVDFGARTHVDHSDRMWKSLHDHEDRLRSIERKVWTAAGVASLMGAGLGVLLDTIISYTQR